MPTPLLFPLDDSPLVAILPSPGVRVAVAQSLHRDLNRVGEWYDV